MKNIYKIKYRIRPKRKGWESVGNEIEKNVITEEKGEKRENNRKKCSTMQLNPHTSNINCIGYHNKYHLAKE